jgi:acyl transferase domain-containing protein
VVPGSMAAAVMGIGLVLPPAVTSCSELWAALLKVDCAARKVPGRKLAGVYLDERAFSPKRDGLALGIEAAEAAVIDPQHVLALALAARCFEDAGQEAVAEACAKPHRCGVYIGAWQEPPQVSSRPPSAYRVLGTSLAAMASRVANTYDIQGPAITINTACSSGLVAVNAALTDLRLGVIDYALVGCVNLLTDEALSDDLARAHFLSPTSRCHTFSAAADGYARSEGGVMLLLARDDGTRPCRALLCGSATNQNSRRRPMTAVDPTAQERVIHAACADGGIHPSDIAVVECHGTGTKLATQLKFPLWQPLWGLAVAPSAYSPPPRWSSGTWSRRLVGLALSRRC